MSSAETISVTMTSDMLRDVQDAVQSGEFASTGEALREAVRVWRRQRLEDAERLEAVRARLRRSLDDPRSDLDEDEAERHFRELHAETVKTHLGAKA